MGYLTGALAGLIFGGAVGYLKNRLVWQQYLKKSNPHEAGEREAGNIYGRAMLSNAVNIITLIVAFLIRDAIPGDGIAFLIGTAVALSAVSRAAVMKKKDSIRGQGGEQL